METALKNGETLQNGKYTIVRPLGQGSFGITYLATTKLTMTGKLGQMDTIVNVAIKEFFMEGTNSRSVDGSSVEGSGGSWFKKYREKFENEAINLSHLSHPNIVKVLEVFNDNKTTYYVMQHIDGESLDDYILRNNGIPEKEAISKLMVFGSALAYMHDHKMLHLDLKPKNVMLDKDGNSFLIDFGLSKQYTDNGEPESSTTIGGGTAGYAPIEQANYKQDGTFPTTLDVYALGATLFKMLTAKKPQNASEVLEDGLDVESLIKKGVSQNTINAITKAMAPIRKYRYQTVSDFLSALNSESERDYTKQKHGKSYTEDNNQDERTDFSESTNSTKGTQSYKKDSSPKEKGINDSDKSKLQKPELMYCFSCKKNKPLSHFHSSTATKCIECEERYRIKTEPPRMEVVDKQGKKKATGTKKKQRKKSPNLKVDFGTIIMTDPKWPYWLIPIIVDVAIFNGKNFDDYIIPFLVVLLVLYGVSFLVLYIRNKV